MGVVYKARHRSLNRLVAMKMVLAGEFASPSQELRFRLEAELAARVQHPNIVQVYEIGSFEGRPFLALEWVEGGSLANQLDGKPWPPGEAAALVETLARAIHVAHGEGVVHRDLKPANILLVSGGVGSGECSRDTTHDSPRTTHHPKITDFGLAQPVDGGRTLTQSGLLVGTPGYMAPEQASGKRALVGPATDTYALGVVLYQLLTGQLPFQGDSTLEVLRAVTSDEPVRPRRLQPRLPRDLEAITLHCLEKEPGRRYSSALALAEDLQRFREGKQVVARPVGAAARLARACRRRPLVALLLALLTVSLFGGLAGVTWKWLEADEQRDLANANALQADAEKQAALYQAYRARIAAASAALSGHDVADAARQLEAASQELRGWEWRHLHSRLDESSAVFRPPDGGSLALLHGGEGIGILSSTRAGLRVLDEDGRERLAVPFAAWQAGRTRHGIWFAIVEGEGSVRLLDEAGKSRGGVDGRGRGDPCLVAVSPDQTRAALAWATDRLPALGFGVYDLATGNELASFAGHTDAINDLAFSPDGTQIASASEDGTARLWNAATGATTVVLRGHAVKVHRVAFRPDGARVLTTSADGTVRRWDTRTGKEEIYPYQGHTGEVYAAVFSPDGAWIASGGTDRTVRLWQAAGRREALVLRGHTEDVTQLAFSRDGRRLASASNDGTVRLWEADSQAGLPILRGHTSYVYPVAYSSDGRWIASGSWDTTVRLWDALTGEPCAVLRHPARVLDLAFTPDGASLVAGCGDDDRLHVWDVATARPRQTIRGPGQTIQTLAIRPDGARIAAANSTGALTVVDVATGQEVASWRLGEATPRKALAYSPDGCWLATLGEDPKELCLWEARGNRLATRWRGHTEGILSVAFSPGGRRIASASMDRTIRVWDVAAGECQAVLQGHTGDVFSAVFHPDGTRIASSSRDRTIRLWDVATGEEVARLQGHTNYVWSLAFSPDGTTLVSGSGDGTLRLWDTQPRARRYQARREIKAVRPEAARLVERLFDELREPAQVVSRLRDDRTLSAPLRRAALQEVMRQGGR
jgi:WD40 repeat protein